MSDALCAIQFVSKVRATVLVKMLIAILMIFALWKEPFCGTEFWIYWDKVWEEREEEWNHRRKCKHESRLVEQRGRSGFSPSSGAKEESEGATETC